MPELWKLENEIFDSGVKLLCGVDEAGRGPRSAQRLSFCPADVRSPV